MVQFRPLVGLGAVGVPKGYFGAALPRKPRYGALWRPTLYEGPERGVTWELRPRPEDREGRKPEAGRAKGERVPG